MHNYLIGAAIFAAVALGAYSENERLTGIHAGEIAEIKAKHAAELEQYTASLAVAAKATDEAVLLWSAKTKAAEDTANATRAKLARLERRACLSADAVRLLNSANSLPPPAERAAGAAAIPTANPAGYASSQAVAAWAAEVQQRYEACRAQVEGLRQWADGAYHE